MKINRKILMRTMALLICAIPVYICAYIALIMFWEFWVPPDKEFSRLYSPTVVFISVLVATNYLAFGWVANGASAFRKASASILLLLAVFYGVWLALLPSQRDYRRCDFYTKEMEGGIRRFQRGSYRIELCGLNGIIQPENFPDDGVRLRVFSVNDELLAERYFSPLLAMGIPITPLEYGEDFLAYSVKDQGPATRMTLPPSRLDKLRTRLPRLWP